MWGYRNSHGRLNIPPYSRSPLRHFLFPSSVSIKARLLAHELSAGACSCSYIGCSPGASSILRMSITASQPCRTAPCCRLVAYLSMVAPLMLFIGAMVRFVGGVVPGPMERLPVPGRRPVRRRGNRCSSFETRFTSPWLFVLDSIPPAVLCTETDSPLVFYFHFPSLFV
ncbi:hypothetical protein IW262DRAFT_889504 [Armillaria fumosa]|nr:hypothetical protein IW262DRAFT_889504 [Armillaria fumosa]